MVRLRLLLAAVLIAAGVAATGVAATAAPAAAAPVRVMPLGDSITGSPGCWRALLWQGLQQAGRTDVDMVGTLPAQGCGVPYDGDNEGHGGALATAVADSGALTGWLAAARPDVVLMHFGTNDVWSNRPTSAVLAAYTTLVGQLRAGNPAMRVLVAQIIPMAPVTCGECAQRVTALNAAIPGWAAGISTAASPVTVVDQWTGFGTATDTYDGVHPNAAGDRKIAARWLPALTAALGGTTPAPTTPAPGGCAATTAVTGSWAGGFQGEVTVRDTGPAPLPGWEVRFTLPAGTASSRSWNAQLSAQGTQVTARPAGWNAALAPGAATTFGYLASGPPATPAATCS
jgi:lysophospholipase L1-like esterase